MKASGAAAEGHVAGDAVAAELASVVAHDANNVLVPMVFAVEQLRAMDVPGVAEHAERIAEGCQRLSSMLRLLLPAAGAGGACPIDVNAVVRALAGTLQTLAGARIHLRTRLQEPLATVLMNRLELERSLLNLVANARDAMPGGGEVVLGTANVRVPPGDSSGLKEGDWVLVVLHDQGVGMDAATCARAFEPFFTTKPSGLGMGLGLASVRRALEAVSGVVRLVSEVGKGTSVEIWLPSAPPPR
jgi:signal transduction histidine kinase